MPYPWPSFGSTFLFSRDETPIYGTDAGWKRQMAYDRQRPLGSSIDSFVAMSLGSAEREFELYLAPTRFDLLQTLISSVAVFTGWERPTPDSRSALLVNIEPLEWVAVACSDGTTQKRIRTAVQLVSQ